MLKLLGEKEREREREKGGEVGARRVQVGGKTKQDEWAFGSSVDLPPFDRTPEGPQNFEKSRLVRANTRPTCVCECGGRRRLRGKQEQYGPVLSDKKSSFRSTAISNTRLLRRTRRTRETKWRPTTAHNGRLDRRKVDHTPTTTVGKKAMVRIEDV